MSAPVGSFAGSGVNTYQPTYLPTYLPTVLQLLACSSSQGGAPLLWVVSKGEDVGRSACDNSLTLKWPRTCPTVGM